MLKQKVNKNIQFVKIGEKKFVIMDEESYDRLLDALDAIEIDKILADDSDPVVPAEQVKDETRKNKIAKARKNEGLSQKALAERMGITQSTLSRIEKESANLKLSTLKKAAKALGCQPHDLV